MIIPAPLTSWGLPITAHSVTLTGNGASGTRYSYRYKPPTAMSTGGRQIRVKFQAATGGGWDVTNASVAILGGATFPNVAATPTELMFSGVSGFALAAGAVVTSDWLNFPFTTSDVVCVHHDGAATNVSPAYLDFAPTVVTYYKVGPLTDYNQATVSGYTSFTNSYGIALIEGRY